MNRRRGARHRDARQSVRSGGRVATRPNASLRRKVRITLTIAGVLASLTLSFILAFFITSYFYRILNYQPRSLVDQLITSGLGILIMTAVGLTIGRFAHSRQMAFWQSLIDAIRQMAKGDFNVNVPIHSSMEDEPFHELVHSINYMAEELGQLEQMRQEFISNVSHEIQSPLTSITGFVQALKNEGLQRDKQLHYLDIIETESSRLSKLSDNLLKLASLDSNQHPFHRELYRLDTQLRDVILLVEPQWVDKDLQMDVSLEKIEIEAVSDLLSQVWLNLVANAIKFTPERGSVRVELQAQEGFAVIRVSDTGIGIAAADQERIFERFYKADKSRNRAIGGSGLGLAIAKKIVDMHLGEIEVESNIGEGTTFTVRLPLHPDHPL